MNELDHYRQELLLQLRLRDVPGPRIAQVLAEVDSHLAESGEVAQAAFGTPSEYAAATARALGHDGAPSRNRRATVAVAVAVAALAGAWLAGDGLIAVASGANGRLGLPAGPSLVVGLLVLGALVAWLRTGPRRTAVPVLDPRTGADLTAPLSRWALVGIWAAPVALVLAAVLMWAARR